jgi:hypothetical protein
MTTPQGIEFTPTEAAGFLHQELQQASHALQSRDVGAALDGYMRAFGLALQLGPAPTEQVLLTILAGARDLALWSNAEGLAKLGPALVGLVAQVQEAGALPPTKVMDAWASVAVGLGTIIGQMGLVLDLAPTHRAGMLDNVRTRAELLDDATGGLFSLVKWIDQLSPASREPSP